jgi:palmitoyltransferase
MSFRRIPYSEPGFTLLCLRMKTVRRQTWDVAVSVLGVTIIVYLWISSHVYIFIPWAQHTWSQHRTGWIVYLMILNLFVFMTLWSFLMAALTNPGEVPSNYKSSVMNVHHGGMKCLNEQDDSPLRIRHLRWCKKCETVKPPRAHHCNHGCEVCILKMDHHCPWIANCVGFRNHGYFLRYVWYCWLTAVVGGCGLMFRVIQMIWMPQSVIQGGAVYVQRS